MWNRACPLCFAKVPRTLLLSHSDDIICPSCQAALELSRPSRVLGAAAGFLAGFVAAHFLLFSGLKGRWFVPMAGAVVTFGVVSALALFFLADLVVRPHPPAETFPQTHG